MYIPFMQVRHQIQDLESGYVCELTLKLECISPIAFYQFFNHFLFVLCDILS